MIYIEELKNATTQKEQSAIGRKLLLKGLQNEYGLSELPEISFGEFGKPFFPSYPAIQFNISHCNKAVACIISDKKVGIDVEIINPFDKELAEYVLSPVELEKVLDHPNPSIEFTILWTRKESHCKFIGKGLDTRKEIQNILVDCKARFETYINQAGGYVLTSCKFER